MNRISFQTGFDFRGHALAPGAENITQIGRCADFLIAAGPTGL
jgi:hypothetical protein